MAGIADITTAANSLSNLILVTPNTNIGYQPQNPPNPDGTPNNATPPPAILFDYEGEQVVTLNSDITDHFVEDNTAIQDQISLKPPTVTTGGYIAELNDIVPKSLKTLQAVADKLTTVGAYVPALTSAALVALSEAQLAYATATKAMQAGVSAWNSINGIASSAQQTKQQLAYQQFFGYWQNRTLFTVQTPWQIFTDMAIQSIRAIQGEDTRVISNFEITFKQMRFASTTSTIVTAGNGTTGDFQGRGQASSAEETDLGTGNTSTAPQSLSSQIGSVA